MSQVPSIQILSLKGHYDHEKLCQHQKTKIPLSIKMGKMGLRILSQISDKMLSQAIDELSVEYQTQHKDKLNNEEKRSYALNVLDRIKHRKWNFVEKNIQQANKFNQYYGQKIIDDIGTIEKDFKCNYCGIRTFKLKAALSSHQRTCIQNPSIKMEKKNHSNGFKKVKNQTPDFDNRPKNVKVEIIKYEQAKIEKNQLIKFEECEANKFKRQGYQINFDSIFEEE